MNLHSHLPKPMRQLLGRIFLRGPMLNWWVRKLATRQAKALDQSLLATLGNFSVSESGSKASPKTDRITRILFLCDNMWERRELAPELEKLCSTTFVDVGPKVSRGAGASTDTLSLSSIVALLQDQKNISYSVIIVYLNGALISLEILDWLRATWKCPLIGINLDDKTTFFKYGISRHAADNYQRWAGHFDYNLSNARIMVDVYNQLGYPCEYLPTGFHFYPAFHHLPENDSFQYPLTFVGSYKPERAQFIHELERRGISIKLFGSGWKDSSFTEQGWKIFQKTQINLGIGYNVTGFEVTNLKNRDFECPGAGGCYLTTYDWELSNLYEIGREILCYRAVDDFVEQYAFYSKRPALCRKIAEAGYIRSIHEHTWENRFRTALTKIGFSF